MKLVGLFDVTHLCPSSVKAKSPRSKSRKRYLGGSDILLFSKSSDDWRKTSSTVAASFVTDVFAAMYPSLRLAWRVFTIRDNTFTKLSEILHKNFFNSFSFKDFKGSQVSWIISGCSTDHRIFLNSKRKSLRKTFSSSSTTGWTEKSFKRFSYI